MPRKLRELRADLRRVGFRLDHQTGSHGVWKHADLPDVLVNLAGRDGADAKSYQENEVRRALERLAKAKEDTAS
jgi:predicted RNA binding protein YcfA (HicA-like mRNA interferase family)